MSLILASVLTLLHLVDPAPAPPQAGEATQRTALRGRVVDADGAAVPGAHVVVLARPEIRCSESGTLDQREARTDDDGRFEVQLLPGLCYAALCHTDPVEGRYSSSAPVDGLVAGGTARLRLDATPRRLVRVRVEGTEAWKDQAPLRCRVDSNYWRTNPGLLRDFDPSGKQPLPALPSHFVSLEVRGKDGLLLARMGLDLRVPKLEERAQKDAGLDDRQKAERSLYAESADAWVLRIAPPGEFVLRVRLPAKDKPGLLGGLFGQQPAKGAPAAGAVISSIDGVHRFELARTDERGLARVRAPSQWGMRGQIVIDHPEAGAMYIQPDMGALDKGRDLDALLAEGKADVEVDLLAGGPVRGKLFLAEGVPLADALLMVDAQLMMGPQSTLHFGKPFLFRTGKDGSFEVPGIPEGQEYCVSLVLDPAVQRRLAGDEVPLSPWVPLLSGEAPPADPVVLRLDMFERIELEAKAEGGRIASHPEFVVAPIHDATLSRWMRNFRGDRRGRLAMLLPVGGEWAIGACLPSGMKTRRIKVERTPEPLPVRLDMARVLYLGGVIQNANSEPLWDCTVRVQPVGDADPSLGLVDGIRFTRDALPDVTDAAGRFRVAVPEPGRKYKLSFNVRTAGGGHSSTSGNDREVEVGSSSIDDLEIVIPSPAFKPDKQ